MKRNINKIPNRLLYDIMRKNLFLSIACLLSLTLNAQSTDDEPIAHPQIHKVEKLDDATQAFFQPSSISDYDALIKESKYLEKPLMLYFSGWAVVNGKKMESVVLSDPTILSMLKKEFIFVPLYVDDQTELPEDQQSKNGAIISTYGNKALELQVEKFKSNIQPYFVILDNNGFVQAKTGYTMETDVFMTFIREGLSNYNNNIIEKRTKR